MITKAQLVAALNVAKNAAAEISAAVAAKVAAETALAESVAQNTALEVSLAAVSAERDEFKPAHEVLTDSEVVALVNELAPVVPEA